MTVARYWRVVIGFVPSRLHAELAEVAFLDGVGGTNLSVGGTAFASSEFSPSYDAAKAFDGNTATFWSSVNGAIPAHIGYDHGAAVAVEAVRLRFTSQYANAFPPDDASVTVQYSDDSSSWSTLRTRFTEGVRAADQTAEFQFYTLSTITMVLVPGGPEAPFAGSALPSGMPTTFLMDATAPYRDMEFAGAGVISGTVKRDADPSDLPLKRRVRLHREQDGMLIREVWSNATTGAYSFQWINETWRYTVITYDYEHDYRAVIADNITPEAMP